MPNDVITLNVVAHELNEVLTGGRIEKIYQPETDEITLFIKNNRTYHTLVISANPSNPRIHLSTQKKENSLNAPAFCMLLRKYLIGSYIQNISIFNSDRIIKIAVISKNELKDINTFYIMAELMGRYSNIILTTQNEIILDAIKRIHFDQSTTRYILPNLKYELQPQNRISLFDNKALNTFFEKSEISADDILKQISGIGKETAREIINSKTPFLKLKEMLGLIPEKPFKPCLRYENGVLRDYYIMPYSTLSGDYEIHDSINGALDKFYLLYDSTERKKHSTKTVVTLLNRLKSKTERRIADNTKKLDESEKKDEYKKFGEILLTNLYRVKPNEKTVVCYDYYNNCDVSINLDPKISPADNAQSYYKKYNKLKRSGEIARQQLDILINQREYLKTIETAINNCSLKSEYDEILSELNSLAGLRQNIKKNNKEKKAQPTHFKVNGFDVYLGKNNLQNNEVTFNIADSKDLWLHVKANHGAHIIIKGQPDDMTISKCASVAAFYSDAKLSEKVEVDYTLKKYVKKMPGAMPGMVTYVNYNSVLVKPTDYTEISDK